MAQKVQGNRQADKITETKADNRQHRRENTAADDILPDIFMHDRSQELQYLINNYRNAEYNSHIGAQLEEKTDTAAG